MSLVTYKAQPGIGSSGGHVSEGGTKYPYRVGKLLWDNDVHSFIETLLQGRSLHVCCGYSRLGTVRIDIDPLVRPDVLGDAAHLPFRSESFDTVLCDPPYNGQFQWNHDLLSELSRVAKDRIVFQHWFIPAGTSGRWKKDSRFRLSGLHAWNPRTYFGRAQLISVFDADAPLVLSALP